MTENALLELLSVEEMYAADKAAMAAGVAGVVLMENAGAAVEAAIRARWTPRPAVVLCGPGNNGGDGFVIARRLAERGWPVRLGLLGDRDALKGDAAHHARLWTGACEPLEPALLEGAGLVVDALFGAGLSRPLDGAAAEVVRALSVAGLPVVAVDVPSGLSGDSGAALGDLVVKADLTVTFFRKKPGHLLIPGRLFCGEIEVADIAIPDDVLAGIGPSCFENLPALWQARLPRRRLDAHKYDYGHALIVGGGIMTGAGRLAALAALRVGAGLVSIAAPRAAAAIYQSASPSLIVLPCAGPPDLAALLADERKNALLLGPGAGLGEETAEAVLLALASGRAAVLDADALSVFAAAPERLFKAIGGPAVLTPHEGEFRRLFPGLEGDKPARARAAAALSGATVVLKGADSVIAAPNGRLAINANAPADLATAGTGDVLAGLIVGLLAQGMPAFEAACAATWLHGAAGSEAGVGLISEDLPAVLPKVLRRLHRAVRP